MRAEVRPLSPAVYPPFPLPVYLAPLTGRTASCLPWCAETGEGKHTCR